MENKKFDIKQNKFVQPFIKIGRRIYYRCLDYFYKVPRSAGICFAYYMIIAIVPTMTLVAFIANIVNVDLQIVEDFLSKYLLKEYSTLITKGLLNAKMSLGTLIILCISTYVVSRGINQIYTVSKNFFPPSHSRNMIMEIAVSIIKTIAVLIIIIAMVASVTVIPILRGFVEIHNETLYLFMVLFTLMTLLYKIVPDCHVRKRDILKGAFVGAGLLLMLIKILEIYFSYANYKNVYGPLASIVIILMSLTFAAEVIYIGMYVMFEAHMKNLILIMTNKRQERESYFRKLYNTIEQRRKDIQSDTFYDHKDIEKKPH